MVKDDDQSPATKGDIKGLRKEIKEIRENFATKNDLKRFATKTDLKRFATKNDLQILKKDLIEQFLFIAENLHRDFRDAFKDRTEQHEVRITRLEKHTGLAAA